MTARDQWAVEVLDAFQEAGGHVSPPKRLAEGWVFYTRNEATGELGRHSGSSLKEARLAAARKLLETLPDRDRLGEEPPV